LYRASGGKESSNKALLLRQPYRLQITPQPACNPNLTQTQKSIAPHDPLVVVKIRGPTATTNKKTRTRPDFGNQLVVVYRGFSATTTIEKSAIDKKSFFQSSPNSQIPSFWIK
jgi:hypothetical protein